MTDLDGDGRLEPGSGCRETDDELSRSRDMSGQDLPGSQEPTPTFGIGGGRTNIIVSIQESARLFRLPGA
jgi:hypothetical protein